MPMPQIRPHPGLYWIYGSDDDDDDDDDDDNCFLSQPYQITTYYLFHFLMLRNLNN
jgi:hypothetical protein